MVSHSAPALASSQGEPASVMVGGEEEKGRGEFGL